MMQFPPDVTADAVASYATTGIPASCTMAQWAVESAWGRDVPPDSFNPFGIKAIEGEPGVQATTREWDKVQQRYVVVTAIFRKFASWKDAFDYHGHLLATALVYAPARACLPNVTAFVETMAAKYATDPNYGKLLLEIIAEHNLTQYDHG